MSRQIRRCLPPSCEAGWRIERIERRAHQQGLKSYGRQDDILLGSAPMAFKRDFSGSTGGSATVVTTDDDDFARWYTM